MSYRGKRHEERNRNFVPWDERLEPNFVPAVCAGFEPTVVFMLRRFSKPLPSATQPTDPLFNYSCRTPADLIAFAIAPVERFELPTNSLTGSRSAVELHRIACVVNVSHPTLRAREKGVKALAQSFRIRLRCYRNRQEHQTCGA